MMKIFLSFSRSLQAGAFIFTVFLTSCDEKPPAPATQYPADSLSVKKMDADSNSDMPVAVPKDSSVTMPNPYEPGEKPPPIR